MVEKEPSFTVTEVASTAPSAEQRGPYSPSSASRKAGNRVTLRAAWDIAKAG